MLMLDASMQAMTLGEISGFGDHESGLLLNHYESFIIRNQHIMAILRLGSNDSFLHLIVLGLFSYQHFADLLRASMATEGCMFLNDNRFSFRATSHLFVGMNPGRLNIYSTFVSMDSSNNSLAKRFKIVTRLSRRRHGHLPRIFLQSYTPTLSRLQLDYPFFDR